VTANRLEVQKLWMLMHMAVHLHPDYDTDLIGRVQGSLAARADLNFVFPRTRRTVMSLIRA